MAAKKPAPKKKAPIPTGLARALKERKRGADSEALLNELMEVWGGPRQFAIDVFAEYQSAAKGGMTRQRILEMMQRLIITNTTNEIGRTIRPSDMSDEELEATAMEYLKKVSGTNVDPHPEPLASPTEWAEESGKG